MIALLATTLALAAPCPAEQPAAMALDGLPDVLVAGKSYEAALLPTGVGETAGRESTLGVYDRTGRGWSATFDHVGFRQAFSVGLTGAPYTVSGSYSEVLGTCTRDARRVGRAAGAAARARRRELPSRRGRAALGDRARLRRRPVRLRAITWRDWNADVAVGRRGSFRVKLSHPRECAELDGFIYTRATVGTRYPIDCPLRLSFARVTVRVPPAVTRCRTSG